MSAAMYLRTVKGRDVQPGDKLAVGDTVFTVVYIDPPPSFPGYRIRTLAATLQASSGDRISLDLHLDRPVHLLSERPSLPLIHGGAAIVPFFQRAGQPRRPRLRVRK